jgi:hypothetical protein
MFGYLRPLIWKNIIRSGGFTRLFGKIAVDLGLKSIFKNITVLLKN